MIFYVGVGMVFDAGIVVCRIGCRLKLTRLQKIYDKDESAGNEVEI